MGEHKEGRVVYVTAAWKEEGEAGDGPISSRPRPDAVRDRQPNFRPAPLRWPFLTALLATILGLLALTEYACHALPGGEADEGKGWTTTAAASVVPTAVAIPAIVTATATPSPPILPKRQRPLDNSTATSVSYRRPITVTRAPASTPPPLVPGRLSNATDANTTTASSSDWTMSFQIPHPAGGVSGTSIDPGAYATDGDVTVTSTAEDGPPVTSTGLGLPAAGGGAPVSTATGSATSEGRGEGAGAAAPSQQRQGQGPSENRGSGSSSGAEVIIAVPVTLSGVETTVTGVTTLGGVTSVVAVETTVIGGTTTTLVRTSVVGGTASAFTSVATLDDVVSTAYYSVPQAVVVLTDSLGVPTATVAAAAAGYDNYYNGPLPLEAAVPVVTTLTDANGMPTATSTIAVGSDGGGIDPQLATAVLTDAEGLPTATVTGYLVSYSYSPASTAAAGTGSPAQPQRVVEKVYSISRLEYAVGFVVPPLVSVGLTILVRMLDLSAKQLHPWHELARASGDGAGAGARARDSLCLQTGGPLGAIVGVRALFLAGGGGGGPGALLVLLTTALLVCSALLVPLSGEAVALRLHGSCAADNFQGCALTLAVFAAPARAAEALLALMAALLVAAAALLALCWRSGVAANPWSIAGIASLSTNERVRALLADPGTAPAAGARIGNRQLAEALEGRGTRTKRTFKLGYFTDRHSGTTEYGIVVADDDDEASLLEGPTSSGAAGASSVTTVTSRNREHYDDNDDEISATKEAAQRRRHPPFRVLSLASRAVFLTLALGLLAVVLYYNATQLDTPFEAFMDNQSFGVRFLFTAVGILITFFWSSFFTSVAVSSPYCLLANSKGTPAHLRRSILLSPPTHAFAGLWAAVALKEQRRGHVYLVAVAFTAGLAEFMPILLNNVPFRVTQTWVAHQVCTWLAVAVLGLMVLVVVASFFVRWPHMPVDPSTIAGAMYYVCDSPGLVSPPGGSHHRFGAGLSTLDGRERDRRVANMGGCYRFGPMRGVSGLARIGLDAVDEKPVRQVSR